MVYTWFDMGKEFLRGLITGRLDILRNRKIDIDMQRENDYWALVGYVVPRLTQVFGPNLVGEIDSHQGIKGISCSLERLLAIKGNSLEKVAKEVVRRGAQDNLGADKAAKNQFTAIVLENLTDLLRVSEGS